MDDPTDLADILADRIHGEQCDDDCEFGCSWQWLASVLTEDMADPGNRPALLAWLDIVLTPDEWAEGAIRALKGSEFDGLLYCHSHGAWQLVPLMPYLVCGECQHVYATAQSLTDANVEIRRQLNSPDVAPLLAKEIFTCPCCAHDF